MRGSDQQQATLFSYISLEQRVPPDHPLRAIPQMVDTALVGLWEHFEALYAQTGRPSIARERLLRALLLQILYSVRSERLTMERPTPLLYIVNNIASSIEPKFFRTLLERTGRCNARG